MIFIEKKLAIRLKELDETRYRDTFAVPKFTASEDPGGLVGTRPPERTADSELKLGDTWKGRDRYVWLTAEVNISEAWKGKIVVGRFDFGTTMGGNNGWFESLAYLNGVPYQGVDTNHTEVMLPSGCSGMAKFDFRLWSGLEGGGIPRENVCMVRKAEICWLDERVDSFYHAAKAVLATLKVLNDSQPERIVLLKALDRAFAQINWSNPRSETFYQSVYTAEAKLAEQLGPQIDKQGVTVTAIGHTHIDLAWLWRLKHTREKAARSFSTVLRLMERYDDYIFLQSQPQIYDYIKVDYPDIYKQIQTRVAEGRWEAGGGMWVEADCNLTSGESLVRQLLFGTRFFKQEFNAESKYLWLPDVFGYSWALPQILQKSGFDTFMTTKISWNQFNRMPHDTFKWRGIDGSEVLTHFITTPDKWEGGGPFYYTYNGKLQADTVQGIWDNYQNKEVNQELLLSYGYGDGGGGVTRDMLEQRRNLDKLPGIPKVRTGRVDKYFERLNETFHTTDRYVHTWDGELYLEFHRGTYTSQAYNKKMNRKLELLYRETEWLQALRCVFEGNWSAYPQDKLNEGWKIILRNQFHDIIPGSSISEVYEDSREEYGQAGQIGTQAWQDAAAQLAAGSAADSLMIVNSSSWAYRPHIEVPAAQYLGGTWKDGANRPLVIQKSGDHFLIEAPEIPSMGIVSIFYEPSAAAEATPSPFNYHSRGIRTPYYEIQWNEHGQLTRIYDLEHSRQVLAEDAKGNVLQIFEDKPMRYDAWDIDIFYQEKMEEVTHLHSIDLKEAGPLRAVIEFVWEYQESTITQQMIVYAKSRRIEYKTHVDWKERQKLLKAAFRVNIRSNEATYDIQFGNVKRPTHWNTSWDWARFEVVGHQWADLSERSYGVSLLNDCKYGYDIKDNLMRLSLLKSPISPDPNADYGKHEFTYALYPHNGDWYQGNTVQEAWMLNNPAAYARGASVRDSFSMFRLSAPNVMIDAVKKAEDSTQLLIRMHEFSGIRSNVALTGDLRIASWRECNLMEKPMGIVSNGDMYFEMKPYEIKTFLLDFSS